MGLGQKVLLLFELEAERGHVLEQHSVVSQERIALSGFRRREEKVRQLGRGKRFPRGEMYPATVGLEDTHLVEDAATLVEHQVGIFGTLHVDIRMEGLDG